MPDERKTPYLRIETDGTPETTRLFLDGAQAPALTQSMRFTAGEHWVRGGKNYDLPMLEMRVAAVRPTNPIEPYHSSASRWIIESDGTSDVHVYRDGTDLTQEFLITTIDFGCAVDGRTYLEIERMVVKERHENGVASVEIGSDGLPVTARETLFDYQASAKAS